MAGFFFQSNAMLDSSRGLGKKNVCLLVRAPIKHFIFTPCCIAVTSDHFNPSARTSRRHTNNTNDNEGFPKLHTRLNSRNF